MFCLESFKMIANGVNKFLLFSLELAIARFTLFIKKIALCRRFVVLPIKSDAEPLSLRSTSRGVLNGWVMMNMPAIR